MDTPQIIYIVIIAIGITLILGALIAIKPSQEKEDPSTSRIVFYMTFGFYVLSFGIGAEASHAWLFNDFLSGTSLLVADLISGVILTGTTGLIFTLLSIPTRTLIHNMIGHRFTLDRNVEPKKIALIPFVINKNVYQVPVITLDQEPIKRGTRVEVLFVKNAVYVIHPVSA